MFPSPPPPPGDGVTVSMEIIGNAIGHTEKVDSLLVHLPGVFPRCSKSTCGNRSFETSAYLVAPAYHNLLGGFGGRRGREGSYSPPDFLENSDLQERVIFLRVFKSLRIPPFT